MKRLSLSLVAAVLPFLLVPVVAQEDLPTVLPPTSAALAPDHLGAVAGESVIVPALKSVRIVSRPDLVQSTPKPLGAIEVLGVTALQNDDATGVLSLALNRPVSRESLERLRTALRLVLSRHGWAFSLVTVPPQDVTDGCIQMVVTESVVGQVKVEGNRYFSDASYLAMLHQSAGEPVDAQALQTAVDRINRNGFRNVATRVEAGAEPGTTDIVIQTRERFPWRFNTGYSNSGTRTTTEDRVNAGVSWGNVLGLGHLASLQWSSDLEAQHSRSLSGNATVNLPGDLNLTVFGAYSEIESVPNGGLSQEGLSWQVGGNLDIPLNGWGRNYSHRLQLGADFKVSDNNLEYAVPPYIIPISDNLTHIAQVRAEYRGNLSDAWGGTSWGLKLTAAPGGLTNRNSDSAFEGSRSGAKARYAYAALDVFRETQLDVLLPGLKWTVRGEFQMSTGNLLGSEQYSGGGGGSVRGYDEGEVVGDNGVFFSQELHVPRLSPGAKWLHLPVRDAFAPFVFHDYARVWNVDTLPGERPFSVHSVGVGATYQVSKYASVRAAYGWQLRDSRSSDTGRNSRLHFAGNLSF